MGNQYAPNKTIWPREVKGFIKQYMNKLPNTDIQKQVSVMMGREIPMGTLRHLLKKLGYRPQTLIHWTEEQVNYLLANYRSKGNLEIANDLNKLKLSKRVFKGKHIEKKMILLGITRSEEDKLAIIEGHKRRGAYPGRVHASAEGTVKVWNIAGLPVPHIKVNGRFTKQARYVYTQHYGPIPSGYMLAYKDCDTMNLSPTNLYVVKRGNQTDVEKMKLRRIARTNWDRINQREYSRPVLPTPTVKPVKKSGIEVKINNRLTVFVPPGTDIKSIIKKYSDRSLAF